MSDVEAETLLSSAPSLPRALFIRLCWRLLPILWLGYVLNIVDRTNLGYAALQMTDDLQLSQRAFGLASGIFFCAYAALQIPSNHALPTVGATRILSACMIGWGACSAATSLVGGETALRWPARDDLPPPRLETARAEGGVLGGVLLLDGDRVGAAPAPERGDTSCARCLVRSAALRFSSHARRPASIASASCAARFSSLDCTAAAFTA